VRFEAEFSRGPVLAAWRRFLVDITASRSVLDGAV
jgi:hypothetical protein